MEPIVLFGVGLSLVISASLGFWGYQDAKKHNFDKKTQIIVFIVILLFFIWGIIGWEIYKRLKK